MILLAALLMSIFGLFLLLLLVVYSRKQVNKIDISRIMRRQNNLDAKLKKADTKTLAERLYGIVQEIAKPLAGKKIFEGLDLKLNQAAIPIAGAEFFIITLAIVSATGILAYVLTVNLMFSAVTCWGILLAIWMLILLRIQKRKTSFTEQLGDCLVTVANALRAGYSFQQAMEVIAKEMEPPISQEFSRAFTDVKMGITLERALEQMNQRVDSADFSLVVTAVLIQREVGGNLAQILDTISETIIERIRMKREIHALTAQGRMSAMVLLALPFAVGVFMYIANPDQFMILFEEPAGQMAIAASIFLDILGFIVIKRIVDIDV